MKHAQKRDEAPAGATTYRLPLAEWQADEAVTVDIHREPASDERETPLEQDEQGAAQSEFC